MKTSERGGIRRAARISRLAQIALMTSALALIAATSTAGASTTKTVIGSKGTMFGKVLVAPNKHTLYGHCDAFGTCKKRYSSPGFHPLIAHGRVVAAPHSWVKGSKLHTIKLPNGEYQVTYYGNPLYTFSGDKKPGQTYGERKKHPNWWCINVDGSPAIRPGY